jgi:hypothetical protein
MTALPRFGYCKPAWQGLRNLPDQAAEPAGGKHSLVAPPAKFPAAIPALVQLNESAVMSLTVHRLGTRPPPRGCSDLPDDPARGHLGRDVLMPL